jgi:hypothetical protein
MADSRYIVGIDLGTTNSVLAYADLAAAGTPAVRILDIPQLVRPGVVEARPLLPSFVYLPGSNELPEGALALPWDETRKYAVGEYARDRGKEVPGRVVSSAKSWLCQAGVDRRSPFLPVGAPEGVARISPVEATKRVLLHLSDAWDQLVARDEKSSRLKQQRVFLCVPASADAAARELTVAGAKAAGLGDVTLIEEPQAAFYAWLEGIGERWQDHVHAGDLVLVVDIGGGTTDFSLIAVVEERGALTLNRIAVGEHILLGGDNMDLALAHVVTRQLGRERIRLDDWQFRALAHGCREAKERLLAEGAFSLRPVNAQGHEVDEYPLVILGRGAGVVGASFKTTIMRHQAAAAILNGFFSVCKAADRPERAGRSGLLEIGLPYESDPSVSRHLARFLATESTPPHPTLSREGRGETTCFIHPTAVLFNGGVMKANALCNRIVQMLNQWLKEEGAPPVRVLRGNDPDLAVARGAVFYGMSARGPGMRIRGGVGRSYYIDIAAAAPTVPGRRVPTKALCVVPAGMEEGAESDVPGAEFGLVVGQPAQFRFYSSTTRRGDRLGQTVSRWQGTMEELAPIEVSLPASRKNPAGTIVPVRLRSKVTAVGTLELWCHERDGQGKWKIELNVREPAEAAPPHPTLSREGRGETTAPPGTPADAQTAGQAGEGAVRSHEPAALAANKTGAPVLKKSSGKRKRKSDSDSEIAP